MNENQNTFEKEINLVELMFCCLRKWRCVVVSMLVFSILAGGYKYWVVKKDNQTKMETLKLMEESGETIEEELIINPNVAAYQLAVEKSEEDLEKKETYLNNSAIMKLDANHLQTGNLNFYIDYQGEKSETLDALVSAYRAYVTDGRLVSELLEDNSSILESEMQYLVSFNNGEIEVESRYEDRYAWQEELTEQLAEYNVFRVRMPGSEQLVFQVQVIAQDDVQCNKYLEIAEAAILEYSRTLQIEIAPHELRLLSSVQTEQMNQTIQDYQKENLLAYTKAIKVTNELREDLDIIQKEEGEFISVNNVIVLENPVSSAIKYAVMGIVMGAFFAIFIMLLFYIMSSRLQSVTRFEEEFGMKLLGSVAAPIEKKWFGFLDRFIYRIHEGAYANIPFEEQIKIVAANIRVAISQDNSLKKIVFAGTIAMRDVEDICTRLKENIDGIELSDYQQPVFSAEALEKLENADGVVFLEKREISVSKYIHQERELAFRRNIKILGVVVL